MLGLAVMSGFLLLAAVVQVNDPDPIVWMCVYGIPGLLTLCASWNTAFLYTTWWLSCCMVSLCAVLLFTVTTVSAYVHENKLSLKLHESEEGRETLGLVAVITWLVTLLLVGSKPRSEGFWKQSLLPFAVLLVAVWIGYHFLVKGSLELPEHCDSIL